MRKWSARDFDLPVAEPVRASALCEFVCGQEPRQISEDLWFWGPTGIHEVPESNGLDFGDDRLCVFVADQNRIVAVVQYGVECTVILHSIAVRLMRILDTGPNSVRYFTAHFARGMFDWE